MNARFNKELHFRDYYLLLINNKFLILFTILVFMLPTWFLLTKRPDYFDAYSQLAMDDSEETLSLLAPNINKKNTGYYTGIFQGRAFQDKLLSSIDTALIPGATLHDKRDFLKNNLNITSGTYASFIKIQCRTDKRDLSFLLVKTATDSLIVFCRNVENQESQQALKAIRSHIQTTTKNYNKLLIKKNQISQEESQGDIRGLNALEAAFEELLVQYELENADLEAKRSYFNKLDKTLNKGLTVSTDKRRALKKKLGRLNKDRKKKLQLGIPISLNDSLKIQSLEKEISDLSKRNYKGRSNIATISKWKESKKQLSQAESDLQYKKTKINSFKKAIDTYKLEHPNIVQQEFKISQINELLLRYTMTHKMLAERLQDERIKISAQTGGLKIVEPPYLPTEPVKRNDYIYYCIAFIVSLILGISLALFRVFIDDSIKSPDDVEKNLALPLLGTIPHIVVRKSDMLIRRKTTRKGGNNLSFRYPELIMRANHDKGLIDESYRSMRTNLLYANPDKDLKSFIITSCGPHEGKSLTAANTALAFAQQGSPTLLVDTDLRRPTCHHLFRLDRGPGLGDIFSNAVEIGHSFQPLKESSLKVLTAGSFLPNASEVLGSKRFTSILEGLKKTFKYIIFDTPPIIAVTDACVLAPKVDGVVLLARAGKTSIQAVERSVQSLRNVNAHLFGCILNDVNLTKSKGYYGYYKNYYQYYHTIK